MHATTISRGSKLAIGINVFTIPPDRQKALLDTLSAINQEIQKHKFPMNVSSNFHRGIDAPVVINYNQYTDRESGQHLRTRAGVAPLLKRTHELSEKHEIRWYEVADVVTAEGPGDQIEISQDGRNLAVIGIFTVEAAKQTELLALLKRYGQMLKGARTPGFIGIATHRGYESTHVASYEQWTSADAHRQAALASPVADMLKQIYEAADISEVHLYDVVSVTGFTVNS